MSEGLSESEADQENETLTGFFMEGVVMGKGIVQASMSLDGYIADPSGRVGPLFDWYTNGDVEFTGADPHRVFRVSAASADYLRQAWANVEARVMGRRLFDLTNGWDGRPPVGEAVFVVTHRAPTDWDFPEAPFTFVTEGVESAVGQAKAFAGNKDVSVSAGEVDVTSPDPAIPSKAAL